MRKTTVTTVTATLAASMLLLAACSGSDDGGTDNTDDSGSGGETSDTSGGEPVELTFWSWAGISEVVEIWNEQNPDIQVTVHEQDGGEAVVTKVLTAIRGGSGAPDLVQAEFQALPTLIASEALADISDHVDPAIADQFPEGLWSQVALGSDAVYAIPQDSGPMMFYYREDVFNEHNLEVPTTWEEYADVARELHEKDPSAYLGTFSSGDPGWFAGLSQQAGASWWGIEGDAWAVDVASEPTQRVAEFWGGLVEEGVIDNKPMYTPEWNAALNDGTQVGWVGAVWSPGVLEGNAGDTKGLWRMAPLPQWDPDAPATGTWGGSTTAVTTQSEHVEAAVEFATWLNTSEEAVKALVTEASIYPANVTHQAEALAEPPAFISEQEDFYDLAGEIAQTVNGFAYGPNVNVAYSAYTDEFAKAAEARSAQAFLDAVTAVDEITYSDLADSGYNVVER